MNPERGSGERGADGVVGDRVVVEISGLAIRSDVLSQKRVRAFDGRDRAEDFDL